MINFNQGIIKRDTLFTEKVCVHFDVDRVLKIRRGFATCSNWHPLLVEFPRFPSLCDRVLARYSINIVNLI